LLAKKTVSINEEETTIPAEGDASDVEGSVVKRPNHKLSLKRVIQKTNNSIVYLGVFRWFASPVSFFLTL
jgi:hypothetical protein